METCVRGFSFMPEIKVETGELKVSKNLLVIIILV